MNEVHRRLEEVRKEALDAWAQKDYQRVRSLSEELSNIFAGMKTAITEGQSHANQLIKLLPSTRQKKRLLDSEAAGALIKILFE